MGNPFVRRNMIRSEQDFWGRKREMGALYSLLLDAEEEPQSVVLIGQRRVGKSSILYRTAQRWGALPEYQNHLQKTVCLLVTLQGHVRSTADEFYASLLDELSHISGEIGEFVNSSMQQIYDAQKLLEKTVRLFSLKGYRFIILLDEFDVVVKNSHFDTDFFSQLRALTQPYNVAFVLAIQRDLDRIWGNEAFTSPYYSSPFFNIFQTIPIGLFTNDEAIEYLTEAASRSECSFTPQDIDMAINIGGTHPYFLTIAAYHLISLQQEGVGILNLPDVEERILNDEAAISVCRYYWQHMDDIEQSVLNRIALADKQVDQTQDISLIVRRLERQGLVIREKDGRLSVFGDIFQKFILNQKVIGSIRNETVESAIDIKPTTSIIDPELTWRSIRNLEIELRKLIEERYYNQFKDSWIDRIKRTDQNMVNGWEENRLKEEKKFSRYNYQPSILNYAYLADLLRVINTEWQLFRDVFGTDKRAKADLQAKVEAIVSVRNPLAHSRDVPENELKRADVYCEDIMFLLKQATKTDTV